MPGYRIGYVVGSAAGDSLNRRLSKALVEVAPRTLRLFEIPIRDLPPCPRDVDAHTRAHDPFEVRLMTKSIESCDGILFISPEYNRLIPGSVKNAIDWSSRLSGSNPFALRPIAVIGDSPGYVGMALARSSLRAVLTDLDPPQFDAPTTYITFGAADFEDDGPVRDDARASFLRDFMAEFAASVQRYIEDLEESLGPR